MEKFLRVEVGGVSLPRIIVGSNWFLGYSHTSAAKDRFIKEYQNRDRIADVLEVFLRYGINAVMAPPSDLMAEAIEEAQQRTGKQIIAIYTPGPDSAGEETGLVEGIKWSADHGGTFCFPHQSFTDPRVNRRTRSIEDIEPWLQMIREHGMIPGLSTHMPETIVYADRCNLDVATYIQAYNALGFLCPVETDWIAHIVQQAKKPVMIIKPLAAGRLLPPTGLAFVWSTIREQDMVVIGTLTPYEAEEDIEISLALLEKRAMGVELQSTRSKRSLIDT